MAPDLNTFFTFVVVGAGIGLGMAIVSFLGGFIRGPK